MKLRLLIIIGISVIVLLGIIIPNFWLEFDDYSIFLCERWFDSHYQCNAVWTDPQCNMPGGGCIFPKQTPLEQFLEKKATAAFNLKLDDYRILSEVNAAYPAYSTGLHKSFVTQAVESDGTRYYLSTTFIHDESLDEINVEIYKIISEKCNLSIISTGSGCESEYLETMEPKPRSSLDGWITGISDKSNSTVTILQGAFIEGNKALDPEVIIVVMGKNNTVTWINSDDVAHTLSSNYENNAWQTGLVKPGESSSVIFNNTGIFSYHGIPGPWISGTVVVLPENYDESNLPSSGDYDFKTIHMNNACTEKPSFCFGVFENGTQIMTQCDFPIHGCSPIYSGISSTFPVMKDNIPFDVNYSIKGGTVKEMTFSNSNSLLILIDSIMGGNLTLNIPRDLLDAKMDYCPPRKVNPLDDTFFVLRDGEEIIFDEIQTTSIHRTLQIAFSDNSTKIEVIGTCLI